VWLVVFWMDMDATGARNLICWHDIVMVPASFEVMDVNVVNVVFAVFVFVLVQLAKDPE